VEGKFAQLRLGVDASIELSTGPLKNQQGLQIGEVSTHFTYAKRLGKWGLFFVDVDDSGEELSCDPFSQAPRELRIQALNKVPELIKKLEQQAEELLRELRSSQQTVEALLEKKT
jgi:hypothetical protein